MSDYWWEVASLFLFFNFIIRVCMIVWIFMWQPEDSLVEFVLTFHLYIRSVDWTQVVRFAWPLPLPTEPTQHFL